MIYIGIYYVIVTIIILNLIIRKKQMDKEVLGLLIIKLLIFPVYIPVIVIPILIVNSLYGNNSGVFSLIIAFLVMIVGYYVAEGILYGNWIVPLQSVFANTLQCIVGTSIAIPISAALRTGFKIRHIKTEI